MVVPETAEIMPLLEDTGMSVSQGTPPGSGFSLGVLKIPSWSPEVRAADAGVHCAGHGHGRGPKKQALGFVWMWMTLEKPWLKPEGSLVFTG